MNNFLQRIKGFIITHKKISITLGLVLIVVIIWIVRVGTNTTGEPRYVLSTVEKGTLITTVSGTGQVSASNQIDIKSKVGGDVSYIAVVNGQKVGAGATIARLDTKDAEKAVRDAETNLEGVKISLEKIKIQNSKENMNANLVKAYDDGFTAASDTFLDLPSVLTGLQSVLGQSNLSDSSARNNGNTAQAYRLQAETMYYKANDLFSQNRINFRKLDRNSSYADIESIINETYITVKTVNDAIKSAKNFTDYMAEDSKHSSEYGASQTTLSTYTNTMNGHASALLSSKTNIKNYKDALPTATLDIQSTELSVTQRENALQDAKDKLADYYIRAPFEGTVATVSIKKTDSISAGTSIATLITKKKVAEISLNEVDIAKVSVGQKVTLTFDAVEGLTIAGSIIEVDSIGTVTQGVVTYNVKIGFDTEDDRIKPSMSVSAAIITQIKSDVFMIPNGAVKNQDDLPYVEVFETELIRATDGLQGTQSKVPPIRKNIEIGISNDTMTEIISGLGEGEKIVSRTIVSSAKATAPSAPSLFGGGTRGVTGGTRSTGR